MFASLEGNELIDKKTMESCRSEAGSSHGSGGTSDR